MEHSRLLKFVMENRFKKTMADPTFNIETDYENSPNISEEVPNEQTIRKNDGNTQDIVPSTGTDTNYTLSPVMTVTKKETALTKGDKKLQRVTVTEDISANEMADFVKAGHDQNREVRKSRIPLLKFKQTVERVKREKKEQLSKDKAQNIHRRSSIPKLKDAKLVKKDFSKHESNSEPTSMEPTAMLEVEFDKIYEEIVDEDPKDIDDNILAVKIDDPEKIETKFEEIIHSYDSNDDIITQPGRTRLSKIPWRKKDGSKFGSLVDRVKNENSAANPTLKDGGFKVSAGTITTKRFSRSSSSDLSDIQKVDVVKSIEIQDDKENDIVKETIVAVSTEDDTIKSNITARGIKRELSVGDLIDTESNKRSHQLSTNNSDNTKTEDVSTKRTGIPIKPERKSLSKELNKRPPSLNDRDFVNKEVIKHEELNEGNNKTIMSETTVKETPIKAEKITRSISRTFQRDGKSITMTPKAKTVNVEYDKLISNDTSDENNKNYIQTNNIKTSETEMKTENLKTEYIVKEAVKVGIPVYTRTTHSYTMGKIQNVELSKTIEWKQADEVKTKNHSRGKTNNELEVTDKKFAPTVIKKEVFANTTEKHDDSNTDTQSLDIKSAEVIDNLKEITDTSLANKTDYYDRNNLIEIKDCPVETEDIQPNMNVTENNNLTLQNKEQYTENVTILKGNVNRLISQISVKDNQVTKTEIDIKEDLPKKKTVLSKIAIFEGKEPAEFSVKIKKCFIGKKTPTHAKADDVNESNLKISESTQPKLDINVNIDIAEDTVTEVRNTPVIVDQIWKFEEQNIKTHEIENDATLPAAIDFTVNNISSETTDEIQEQLGFNINEVIGKISSPSPAFDYNESSNVNNQIEEPDKICIESDIINKIEDAITTPGKIDFITNENHDNIVKYSAEKVASSTQEKKPKVGKLDLSLWNKQVEVNKQHIGTGKSENLPERPNIAGNIESKYDGNQVGRSDINLESNGRLESPVILPETPLTRRDRLDFVAQKSHLEIPIILSEKKEPKVDGYKVDSIKTFTGINNAIQTLPEYVDFKEKKMVTISAPVTPNEIESISSENKVKTPKTVTDLQTDENGLVENIKTQPDVLETSTKGEIDPQDREVPSDPELVDSEPEARDTATGKLKNSIFFISNTRAGLNKTKNEETEPFVENNEEVNTINNDPNNNVQNEEFFTERPVSDLDSKSDIEIGRNISREDFKRAKSLAELDLGDVVKGQVQKMVYRIKSVDFDKIDAPRTRKISIKEMPKKCSVLEKIALFEGKVSTETTKKGKLQKTEVTTNKSQEINQRDDFEESYRQKIEDLSTAKVRYGKMDMLYLNLGNDVQMPVIALGTALLDPQLTSHVVSAAIDLGYRAIDTAYIYGNERQVGEAIRSKIDDGTIKREDLYVISKLWSTFHHPELVEKACRASLEALGLDYVDLYLIHNPMSFKEGGDPIPKIATVIQFSEFDYLDAWFAMEKLVHKGLVRSIGVSNFNSQQIQRILDKGRVKPVINQVECHPYLSQHRLQMFCAERNITLSCFGVLGSKGTPSEYKSGVPAAIDDPLVQVMASGLNVTPAQLLVRYQIQSGRNAVVKASSASHLWDILQALTFTLEQHQIDALSALNRNKRIFTFKGMGDTHKNYPFRAPF